MFHTQLCSQMHVSGLSGVRRKFSRFTFSETPLGWPQAQPPTLTPDLPAAPSKRNTKGPPSTTPSRCGCVSTWRGPPHEVPIPNSREWKWVKNPPTESLHRGLVRLSGCKLLVLGVCFTLHSPPHRYLYITHAGKCWVTQTLTWSPLYQNKSWWSQNFSPVLTLGGRSGYARLHIMSNAHDVFVVYTKDHSLKLKLRNRFVIVMQTGDGT